MRGVRRGPAPACLATDTPEAEATHRRRYDDLRYPSGGIRPLWNELAKDERGVGAVRRALLTMTGDECAYCGLLVGNDHMQVDHVLPKEEFPFLAYAWANLLPSCDACNRRKLELVPERLRGKVIVERCMKEHRVHDFVFDKEHLFLAVASEHRLIDPSFDDPEEHLEILMDFAVYRPKTPIGRVTHVRLFARREDMARLANVKEAAPIGVDESCTEELLEHFAKVSSHPSLFRRFVAYWREERDAGRLAPTAPRT